MTVSCLNRVPSKVHLEQLAEVSLRSLSIYGFLDFPRVLCLKKLDCFAIFLILGLCWSHPAGPVLFSSRPSTPLSVLFSFNLYFCLFACTRS